MNNEFKILFLLCTPVCLFSSHLTLLDSKGNNINSLVTRESEWKNRRFSYVHCFQNLPVIQDGTVEVTSETVIKYYATPNLGFKIIKGFLVIKEEPKSVDVTLTQHEVSLQVHLAGWISTARQQSKLYPAIFQDGEFKVIKPLASSEPVQTNVLNHEIDTKLELKSEQGLNSENLNEINNAKINLDEPIEKEKLSIKNRILSILKQNRLGSFLLRKTVFLLKMFGEWLVGLFFKVG